MFSLPRRFTTTLWMEIWGSSEENFNKINQSDNSFMQACPSKNSKQAITITHKVIIELQFRKYSSEFIFTKRLKSFQSMLTTLTIMHNTLLWVVVLCN